MIQIVKAAQLSAARLLADAQDDGPPVYTVAIRLNGHLGDRPHGRPVIAEPWSDGNLRPPVLSWRLAAEVRAEFRDRLVASPSNAHLGESVSGV